MRGYLKTILVLLVLIMIPVACFFANVAMLPKDVAVLPKADRRISPVPASAFALPKRQFVRFLADQQLLAFDAGEQEWLVMNLAMTQVKLRMQLTQGQPQQVYPLAEGLMSVYADAAGQPQQMLWWDTTGDRIVPIIYPTPEDVREIHAMTDRRDGMTAWLQALPAAGPVRLYKWTWFTGELIEQPIDAATLQLTPYGVFQVNATSTALLDLATLDVVATLPITPPLDRELLVAGAADNTLFLATPARDLAGAGPPAYLYVSAAPTAELRLDTSGLTEIHAATFSADGKLLAVAGAAADAQSAARIVFYAVPSGALVGSVLDQNSVVDQLQFTRDGREIWRADTSGDLRSWEVPN